MLRKYYTANIVLEGKIIGHTVCRLWLFKSPWKATDMMSKVAKRISPSAAVCDVRRLR